MLNIREVSSEEAPLSLLLLADPSEEHIARYLPGCIALLADVQAQTVGVLLLKMRTAAETEIMNIAVAPAHQGLRIGTALIEAAVARARQSGAVRLLVGTGNSSLGEIRFYQRVGFRVSGVTRDYFQDYDPPIIEDGIRCLDMIHLVREL